jgi:hypothetical protein
VFEKNVFVLVAEITAEGWARYVVCMEEVRTACTALIQKSYWNIICEI